MSNYAEKLKGPRWRESGIYKISSRKYPSRIYIGSSVDVQFRWKRHLSELKNGKHNNQRLQNHFNKYGEQDLLFFLVETCEKKDLMSKEQAYLNNQKTYFNILRTAYSLAGFKHSKETKDRLSAINLGKKMTKEQNRRNSEAQRKNKNALGAIRTIECRRRLSELKKRKVINMNTNEVFDSIGDAADSIGVKYQTLYARLSGRNRNDTNLNFL